MSSTKRPILEYLPADVPSFRCAGCTVELALQDELISRSFSGSAGPAFLVRSTINTISGPSKSKNLLTGRHEIGVLSCKSCGEDLGSTYYSTGEVTQKYKEGKFILESVRIYKDNKWG